MVLNTYIIGQMKKYLKVIQAVASSLPLLSPQVTSRIDLFRVQYVCTYVCMSHPLVSTMHPHRFKLSPGT